MTDVETRWTADEQRLNRLLHRAVDDAEPAAAAPTVTRPVEPVTDLGRRRRWTLVAVPLVAACVAAAVVAGIGLATQETRTPAASTPPVPPVEDIGALFGSWDVDLPDQRAEDVDLRLELTGRSGRISQRGCGAAVVWQAHSDGLLLADVTATFGTGGCPGPAQQGWVEGADGFHVVDADRIELVRGGAVVASLTRMGDVGDRLGPVDAVVPLPDGLRAPSVAELEGRWTEVGESRHWLTFEDGRWATSADGCNTTSGDFALSPFGGLLRSVVMDTTLAGCGDALPGWPVVGVERLGLDGEVLVLLDAKGNELLRMERGGSDLESVLDGAQGRWASVGPRQDGKPFPGLWLEIEGDILTHAEDANCNTDPTGYKLSADGEVVDTVDAWAYLDEGAVICQPDFPDLVPGRVGRIDLDGDQLVLLNPGGSEIARFEREQP